MAYTSNDRVGMFSTLAVVAVSFVVSVPALLLTAYVMVEVWGWWAVPVGLPPLPFWLAVTIDFIYALIRGPRPNLTHTAELDAIHENAESGGEYFMMGSWWAAKITGNHIIHVLGLWAMAFVMHMWLQ